MIEWHEYPKERPYWDNNDNALPIKQSPKWYPVKFIDEDGKQQIGQACWWLNTWYCFHLTVIEWEG